MAKGSETVGCQPILLITLWVSYLWLSLQTWYLFPGRGGRAPRRAQGRPDRYIPNWPEGGQRALRPGFRRAW